MVAKKARLTLVAGKHGPTTNDPWQLRVLQRTGKRKSAALDPPAGEHCAEVELASDAERDAFFLPRFVRAPNGSEWS